MEEMSNRDASVSARCFRCRDPFTMDKTVSSLEHAKLSILLTSENVTKTNEKTTFGSTLLYLIVSLILAVIALGLVRVVPMAIGSGIPRMKSLFSGGIYFHYFLSWRTLFVKTVGLTCAYAAGLTVGKEGPFVHIAACVATLLTRFSPFKRYADVSRLRHGLLATACATGVVAAFGCPFGGIIFAIEAVSTWCSSAWEFKRPHSITLSREFQLYHLIRKSLEQQRSNALKYHENSDITLEHRYVLCRTFLASHVHLHDCRLGVSSFLRSVSRWNLERRQRYKIQRYVVHDRVAIDHDRCDVRSHVRCVSDRTCFCETIWERSAIEAAFV